VTKYIVDTQLVIRAFRHESEEKRMKEFLAAFSSSVYLSSVVVQELLAGARNGEFRRVQRVFIQPFEQMKRVATPTHTSWVRAGHILNSLRRAGHTISPSLTNDVLVAASAVQIGATVVQDNEKDFAAIQRAYPSVSFTAPWPDAHRNR
jgi:predicted nucleic acid-binding protein